MEGSNYDMHVFCKNCHFRGKITIPKGVRVDDFECPQCSVKDLDRDSNPPREDGGNSNYYFT